MDKNTIKKFAVWARRDLIERVAQKAAGYGITADEIISADADSIHGELLSDAVKRQRKALITEINEKGYEQVVEEVAYTWFNRLIALRFMEVNGYLPSHIRVFTNDDGAFQPQILSEAINLDPADWDGIDMERIYALKQDNKDEELFKYLLILQCNALNAVLPEMFEKIEHYTELLLPDYLLREGSVIEQMIALIPEDDWREQVQIIGWLYQYYNSEKKDAVFEAMKKNVKVSKDNIPAATQLFTPDWIVRYMVENSLGRLWVDGHADTSARAEWKYYLDEAEQTPEVQAQLAEIREGRKNLTPEQIRFIDPCMGSGHILVYAFDVLMQIYVSCGYSERDAAQSIVQHNLWGLDLDKRAYQLAYFALMMKARQYDRRFLTRGIKPNLSHFQDLSQLNYALLDEPIRSFVQQFENADTYGSLISVQPIDGIDAAVDAFGSSLELSFTQLEHFMQLYKILSQRYDVVCTNPPYMGSNNMNALLVDYLKNSYPDSKSDFFAAFIERGFDMAKQNGYNCMVTMQSWMFLSSYEVMRQKLLNTKTISHLMHMENMVMGIAFGTAVTSFMNCYIDGYRGTYNHIKFDDIEDECPKEFPVKSNRFAQVSARRYSQIPSSPIAYWVSDSIKSAFETSPLYGDYGTTKKGVLTGNDVKYTRIWHEVSITKIGFGLLNHADMVEKNYKWIPATSGGAFRRWYGNFETIINMENDSYEIKYNNKNNFRLRDSSYYFRECITWSEVSSKLLSNRFVPQGILFGNSGPVCFFNEGYIYYLSGLLNSIVSIAFLKFLSPTMTFGPEQIKRIPTIISDKHKPIIDSLVKENIAISKTDWDSFETSWDFKVHPLIDVIAKNRLVFEDIDAISLSECFDCWAAECEERFAKLKANEEKLNRIFIDIYGLQKELTPEVVDKDVSVRKADLQRDIKSLISYAVGCMFGRYSLNTEGLVYAGGDFSDRFDFSTVNWKDRNGALLVDKNGVQLCSRSKDYEKIKVDGEWQNLTFPVDADGILPICDDEYFEDDIVGRFVKFIETVYGSDTLEENLKFIAAALGGKGSPREVIRNYFLNGFFADHCKTYQKRPIYWLFDSGKKNGFKCLIYLHRYRPDTIARIRTDYLHEQQGRYRTAIADYEQRVANAGTSERVKLTKRLNALKEQAEEARLYEEKIHHLADQMISIDLDDGVKHNYEIFKDVLAKIK